MPRENSLTDSEGRSLTPDYDEDDAVMSPASANYSRGPNVDTPQHLDLERVKTGQSKRSLHSKLSKSHPSATLPKPSPWAPLGPKERFRTAVHKVVSMHRGTTLLGARGVGAEPGIDPRRPAVHAAYMHIQQDCDIEVIDYSSVRSTYRRMNNEEFVDFMEPESGEREGWVKVRWINIGGISWDVIRALSIKYHLHPLALEDIFQGQSRHRSKADYYTTHLFLRVLCHELGDNGQTTYNFSELFPNAPRSTSLEPISDFNRAGSSKERGSDADDPIKYGAIPSSKSAIAKRWIFGRNSILPTSRDDIIPVVEENVTPPPGENPVKVMAKEDDIIQDKSDEHKLNVDVSPMFFFLFRDGTIISIRPTSNLSFTAPIAYRLKSRDTVLRKSADASLLLHAMLDLMHILSGDLILHKRTLDPIKTLIYGLRRYDLDRCAALIDSADPDNKDVKVVGYMSNKTKIYLADVYDHMEYILASLDMIAGIAENLINYSFNLASYEMNNVIRRLTICTIIFLPLTFLTGYFGMNFVHFWSVRTHSDFFFWKITIPIMLLVIPVALLSDLKKLWHSTRRRRDIRRSL
ncbi:hypothetical protein BDZ97DRAFT_1816203 [Flammula alnicola]|nr:hypothetical protein BDZ97DRAFT_1816203 [Flammula alnicola]